METICMQIVSPLETICMKCQSLYSGKNKIYFDMSSAENFSKIAKRKTV